VVKTANAENHANVENPKSKRKKVARTYAQIVPVTTANVEILAIVDTARKKRKVTKNYALIANVVIAANAMTLANA
jgi:hypothetical protein